MKYIRKGQLSNYVTNVCNLNKQEISELISKTETNSQAQKTNLWLPQGKGGGLTSESTINRYILAYIK